MKKLVVIRGLPGSGKSTMARVLSLVGFKHYEADMFFERTGKYDFDPEKLSDAHAWCQQMTAQALSAGHSVVVANTFTRAWEVEPYRTIAKEHAAALTIVEAKGQWQSVHGVPPEAVERMRSRWEIVA